VPKTRFASVDDYIASQPAAARDVLTRVRGVIAKTLPAAEEVISYQIPAFKLRGQTVIFFAGWKQHYSLYPLTDPVMAAFKKELAGYELAKGTIRFPLSEPVPAKLIARIARVRAKEVAGEQRTGGGARKP
jgi:uncharacterized protein YdhG (YjbR/CyaY superfamily)